MDEKQQFLAASLAAPASALRNVRAAADRATALKTLLDTFPNRDAYHTELDALQHLHAWFRVPTESDWPFHPDCFGVLRGRGTLIPERRIAIVGARKADATGLEITARLATSVINIGGCVVSGGAFGVDITAHRQALRLGGRTIAVLGSGLCKPAPASHRADFRRIESQGAIVSPLPCHQGATRWTFPVRNRWIAGLCDTVLVVQAGLKSGALQTARHALAMGRTVWIVPGPMDHPLHQGCHALVDEGARILCNEHSWYGETDVHAAPQKERQFSGPEQGRAIWETLAGQIMTLEALSTATGLGATPLAEAVTILELEGWLRRDASGGFMRSWPDKA